MENANKIFEFPLEQKKLELARKSFHSLVGVAVILIFIFLGRHFTAIMVLTALIIGIILSELGLRGYKIPIITDFLIIFDRPEDLRFRPGVGVIMMFSGFALVLTAPYLPILSSIVNNIPAVTKGFFLSKFPSLLKNNWDVVTVASMLPSAFADTFSTIVGVYFGKTKLKYNRRKSIAGSIANFFAGFIILMLVVSFLTAFITAIIIALIESLPHLDDNFNIPVSGSVVISVCAFFKF